MRNFKMTLSYDGSRYFGWERQPGKETIQGKLEAVLTRMCEMCIRDSQYPNALSGQIGEGIF